MSLDPSLLLNSRQQLVLSPEHFDAVIFDMDGVVTRTAIVHFAAWKEVFDELLAKMHGQRFQPFTQEDYLRYVDGMPREAGIESFLNSRGIELPRGKPDDPPGLETQEAIGRLKTDAFLEHIHTQGLEAYETTVALIRSLRSEGISIGLVTASKNGVEILHVANLIHLFDAVVTGVELETLNLRGKPAPDSFLECARRLSVSPARSVVVEDAEAGVEAGHAGHFGLVIGVARQRNAQRLKSHGADIVVEDLAEVTTPEAPSGPFIGMAMAELDVTEANWIVSYDNFDPSKEQARESLCTLGNGKFFTRGAACESHGDGVHYPGTYVAGGYNSVWLKSTEGLFEREELVNLPNWLLLTFKIENGEWFDLSRCKLIEYSQKLNLREGILYRNVKFQDDAGRVTQLDERRFVHMRYSHMAGLELSITPVNWNGSITVRSAIDGTVINANDDIDPAVQHVRHLEPEEAAAVGDIIFLKMITSHTRLSVAEAVKTEFLMDDQPIEPLRSRLTQPAFVAQDAQFHLSPDNTVTVRKKLAFYTSRDRGVYEAGFNAREALLDAPDFDILVSEHKQSWRSLWRQFDLFIETKDDCPKLVPSLLLHLNSFHCIQAASPHTVDLDAGVPARGWTGEGYQGHVFWDDLFVFPFINLRLPSISASLLKYRYRRLAEARKLAKNKGARGACFPWQSASDGRERTPEYTWVPGSRRWILELTNLEIHVNGAIAYNIWQYFQVTGDIDFMNSYGSEVLLEIARFFATYAKYNLKKGRYEISGVVGPDEYHNAYPGADKPGLKNNAYTNVMAVWTITRALELLKKLPSDQSAHIRERLSVTDEELELWDAVSRKMFVPIDASGLISQFEGYDDLKEFPTMADGLIDHDALTKALREHDGELNDYKVSKQADVLMLGYLFSAQELKEIFERLGYSYSLNSLAINADFYVPRTANASTLSRVALCWVLAKLERLHAQKLLPFCQKCQMHTERETATQLFYEALGSDYYDVASRGTTRTGIHMGAMAGAVDIVQRCYTGLVMKEDVLWVDPQLPRPLHRLSFNIHYRRQSLEFYITHDTMKVVARHSTADPIKIGYAGKVYELNAGETKLFRLEKPPSIQRPQAA